MLVNVCIIQWICEVHILPSWQNHAKYYKCWIECVLFILVDVLQRQPLYNHHGRGTFFQFKLFIRFYIQLTTNGLEAPYLHRCIVYASIQFNSIQIKLIAILLHMKFIFNKRQVKLTTKWYHMSPSCNGVWINTKYKKKKKDPPWSRTTR